jgi:hypothetical protein
MQQQLVVAIVSYCSKERKYIGAIVRNAVKFADRVVVCMGTRLYSGEDEDVDAEWQRFVVPHLTEDTRDRVVRVVYEVQQGGSSIFDHPNTLHNTARLEGVAAASALMSSQPFWALFLDGDEVPDGDRFRSWLSGNRLNQRVVYKLANYWAFLHPRLVATSHEDSVLLAHSSVLTQSALSHPRERDGIYLWHWTVQDQHAMGSGLRLIRDVMGEDSAPMFWHFSWVRGGDWPSGDVNDTEEWSDWIERTRGALKAKCAGWGHCGDREWNGIIDRCMSQIKSARRFPERDFVHGHALIYLPRLPAPLQ